MDSDYTARAQTPGQLINHHTTQFDFCFYLTKVILATPKLIFPKVTFYLFTTLCQAMASIMLAEKSTGIMSATAFKSPIIDRSIPFPAWSKGKMTLFTQQQLSLQHLQL